MGLVRWLLVLAIVGCGRVAFDPLSSDGSTGGTGDDGSTGDGQVATADLLALWTCDDDPSDGLDDTVGGHAGTCGAGVCPTSIAGQRGTACRFDGVDDVVSVASTAAFETGRATIALWWRIGPSTVGGSIEKQYSGSLRSWGMFTSTATVTVQLYVTDGATNVGCFMADNTPVDTWHYIAMTVDGGDVALYVDGQLRRACSGTVVPFDSGPITFGRGMSYIRADLDEIRMYSRALTLAEITALQSM